MDQNVNIAFWPSLASSDRAKNPYVRSAILRGNTQYGFTLVLDDRAHCHCLDHTLEKFQLRMLQKMPGHAAT
jgi:hypothetical protein